MQKHKRLAQICEIIRSEHRVNVALLCKQFGVTEVTIRRDLLELEQRGILEKVYGGAIAKRVNSEHINHVNESSEDQIRDIIADLALNNIDDNDTIFLGSGNTCCALAKKLNKKKNISVVTNNISALADLYSNVFRVYLIGGEITSVDNVTLFSSIKDPTLYLKRVFVSKSFMSATGIDMQAGITVNSTLSTHVFKYVSSVHRQTYLMMDSEKFGRIGFYQVAEIEEIDCVISDYIPPEYSKYLLEQGVVMQTPETQAPDVVG